MTLTTPFGHPASLSISISSIVAPGTRSDGFTIDVLPVVIATGKNHNGIIAGKLNGAIPAVTPSGNDNEYVSMSLATFGTISPICRLVILHMCSTTSGNCKNGNIFENNNKINFQYFEMKNAHFSVQKYYHLRSPRKTSPSASTNVLPCSFVIFSANNFIFERMIWANLNITCCRVKIDVWLHDLNAALDDSTAASISLCVDFGTRVTN